MIPLTRTIRGFAVEVVVGTEEGVPTKSVINTDTVITIPKSFLREYITTLSELKMIEVEGAVKFALGIG